MPLALPEKNALVVRVRNPNTVTSVIPKHQVIVEDGVEYVAVPHTPEVWQVLRNLGVNVRDHEPIRWHYNFPLLFGKHRPLPHQLETAVFCSSHRRGFVLNEMRTGKSASTLWAADYLMQQKLVKSVLILCTMSCMERVWKAAIFGLFPYRTVCILHGAPEQRRALLRQKYDYYIVNHDGIKVGFEKKVAGAKPKSGFHADLLKKVESGAINLAIVDEGAEFREGGTSKYAALKKITDAVEWLWWLTGTPTPNGPDNAWAQCRIVNPSRVPEFHGAWKDRTMFKINQFKWVPKDGWKEQVFEAMQPAVRYKKSDVLTMMPVTYDDRDAELTPEQRRAYDEIKQEGILASKGGQISAANAAVLMGKMLQISAGAVKNDDGSLVYYPPTHRFKALDEIVDGADAKVIVFAFFHGVIDILVEHLSKHHTTAWIDGRVTGKARDKILHDFQERDDPHILVAHPKTTGHGLELSAADTVVWFAPWFSTDLYEQANNRIMSGLQKKTMGVYHIGCTPLDWRVFKSVRAGVKLQAELLKMFDEVVLEKRATGGLG